MYSSIFLIGFRGTGKTTISKELAQKLDIPCLEIDDEIVKHAERSIPDITQQGTSWKLFRDIEHEVFLDLIATPHIIVGTGGGTLVNEYYGEEHRKILQTSPHILPILLTADEHIISDRIRHQEIKKTEIRRPILNEQKAKELQTQIKLYVHDPEKQKEMIISSIIDDSIEIYRKRKPLYEQVTRFTIDTEKHSVKNVVDSIITIFQSNVM